MDKGTYGQTDPRTNTDIDTSQRITRETGWVHRCSPGVGGTRVRGCRDLGGQASSGVCVARDVAQREAYSLAPSSPPPVFPAHPVFKRRSEY